MSSSPPRRKKRKRSSAKPARLGEKSDSAEEGNGDADGLIPPELCALLGIAESPTHEESTHRIRNVEHMEGMWAAHVYLPVDIAAISAAAAEAAKAVCNLDPGCVFNACDEHHVSLSRTLYLQRREIDLLVGQLVCALGKLPKFSIEFATVGLFTNEEQTTSFLGLNVGKGNDEVCRIIATVDAVLMELHHEPYFQNPKPHCTIGWKTGDMAASVKQALRKKHSTGKGSVHNICVLTASVTYECSKICIKCGNQMYTVDLE